MTSSVQFEKNSELVTWDCYFEKKMKKGAVCKKVRRRSGWKNIFKISCVHTVKGQTNKHLQSQMTNPQFFQAARMTSSR